MRRLLLVVASALVVAAAGCGSSRTAEGKLAGCADCHGFPPAAPHPQAATTWAATDCALCHPTSVDATTGQVIPVSAGGTHGDGKVEGGHALPFKDPALHGPMADAGIALCQSCHGASLSGGTPGTTSCLGCHTGATAFTNCTLCHGTFNASYGAANLPEAAPPADVAGTGTATTDLTVGVHQAHVTAANPVGCGQCHSVDGSVPADIFTAGHLGPSPAPVPFGPIAKTRGKVPAWNRSTATCASTWCHDQGGSDPTPNWTVAGARSCGSCHPSAPTTNAHTAHLSGKTYSNGFACASCHVVPGDVSHLDGIVGVDFSGGLGTGGAFASGTCSSVYCHGATLSGGQTPTPTWTGAIACSSCHGLPPATGQHARHVNAGVACDSCHASYTSSAVNKAVHVNGTKDVTLKFGGTWDATAKSCTNPGCHGTQSW